MPKIWLAAFMLASCSLVYGQLDSDSLTINVSRTLDVPPDQIVLSLTVTAPATASLDDIVAALQGTGVTAANLSGVAGPSLRPNPLVDASSLTWFFSLPVSFAQMRATLASLTALTQAIAKKNPALSLAVSVQGARVSPESQASTQCAMPDLIADAQAQARMVAQAAGLTAGPIVALADAAQGLSDYILNPTVPTASVRSGLFTIPTASVGLGLFGVPLRATVNCSIAVKFKLLRYQ